MRRRVFVVLGMHRGGTSLLARGLGALGIPLGERLLAPAADNETGFWEDVDILALNEEVLAAGGESWHSLRQPVAGDAGALDSLVRKGADLLAARLAPGGSFAFKDPRTARLLPFWQRVFEALEAQPHYAIALRNPLSVAESLRRRNALPGESRWRIALLDDEKIHLLWLGHMAAALRWTEKQSRVVVDFDRLVDNPAVQMQRVARALRIPSAPGRSAALDEFAGEFLAPQLRHARFGAQDVEREARVPRPAARLFGLLDRLARDAIAPQDRRGIAEARELWDAFADFAPALALAERALHTATERGRRLEQAAADAAAREQRLGQVETALAETERLRARLAETVLQQDERRVQATAEAEQAAHLQRLRLEEEQQRTTLAQAALQEARARLEEERRRADAELKAEREHGTALTGELNAARAEIGLRAHREQSLREAADAVAGRYQNALTRLEQNRISTFWRASALLRRAWSFAEQRLAGRNLQFRLVPNAELRALERAHSWQSLGDDPYFRLIPEDGRYPGGWVLVRTRLVRRSENRTLKLYYAAGAGLSEQTSLRLPATPAGAVRELVRLPPGVRELRWDPLEGEGELAQGPVVMSRVGWLERQVRMLLRVARAMRLFPKARREEFGLTWRRALTDLEAAYRVASAMRDAKPEAVLAALADEGDPDLAWRIESPSTWMLSGDQVVIRGWCHSRSRSLTGIRALTGRLRPAQRGELSPGSERFDFTLPVSLPRGPCTLRIEVERDGRWVPLCRVTACAQLPVVARPEAFTYADYQRQEAALLGALGALAIRESGAALPLISVVMPVFNPPPAVLQAALDSVRAQTWPRWELVAVDDASTDPAVAAALEAAAAADERIRVLRRIRNGGISSATNDGFAAARGEWIALLDHDDALSPHALALVAGAARAQPQADLIYTDQDKLDAAGARCEPFFKPDWSPLWFRGVMYLGHLLVARRALLDAAGGCDARFDGVQDYELALRLSERAREVAHVPYVLYHWRMGEGSIAAAGGAKPRIDELQAKAAQESLDRLGIPARAHAMPPRHRVRLMPVPHGARPLVSILIPTRDRPELIARCLDSLYRRTRYPAFEVIVGDNETVDAEALRAIAKHPVRRVALPGAFHFSRFNNRMAAEASGEFLLLLNNDTEVIADDWLEHLVLRAGLPDAGAVGPLLLYANGLVQHAGVVLGTRGTADHVMRGYPPDSDGYFGSLACDREVSAVTGACLLVRAALYRSVGGLNERFRRHYEDVDFCLRLRALGKRNILVAATRLIHHESRSRGGAYNYTDRVLLLDRWEPQIRRGDPYHSRHFGADLDYRLGAAGLRP